MDPETRGSLGERVAKAAAGFGYVNAGTVEFLRTPEGDYYFMEMNTRLQVEHPVTEMVTGVDLVEEQIRLAARNPLSVDPTQLVLAGHAIEFRINAEDPNAGFRPDPGEIAGFSLAQVDMDGVRVRWDSAIRSGYRIPPHYDSMIGKLIVHGPDRETALEASRRALDSLSVEGVSTTIGLHRRILDDPSFCGGEYDVDFLAEKGLVPTS
jgi:acetyl-CoA carboxylase biotin carboxylase subunit